jgi:heterodisulfide reductase subunit A-like polyferredoxin
MNNSALVIGGSIAGIQAFLDPAGSTIREAGRAAEVIAALVS